MTRRNWWVWSIILFFIAFAVAGSGLKVGKIFNKTLCSETQELHSEEKKIVGFLLPGTSPIVMENYKLKNLALLGERKNSSISRQQALPTWGDRSLQTVRLIPGGQSIGVKVSTKGVLVVGYRLIDGMRGQASPGENAGVRIGDVITKINDKTVHSIDDVQKAMSGNAATPLKLSVIRQKKILVKTLVPVEDRNDRKLQLGLYVRDSASGIGTMTFYDPVSGRYGALGHIISDRDTGQPILINNGRILASTVQAIEKGAEGKPGEKIAFFSEHDKSLGSVDQNTPFGIYGKLLQTRGQAAFTCRALPIARADEVHEGRAQILTVLSGHRVETFDIKILNTMPQQYPATKSMVIKIIDPRLLRATGGIIQGMSGSPIIQDGKLVGAVTHVFVNDPTCGYGVHIEWMLRGSGIMGGEKAANKARDAS
ncbi:MAG: SpoIVB peptidase [Sporolactobacillus sp.]